MAYLTGNYNTNGIQPSRYVPYTGGQSIAYYKGQLLGFFGGVLRGVMGNTSGASGGHFVGVADNRVALEGGKGSSQAVLNVWKFGEYTYNAVGTGASTDIGLRAYAADDNTVGPSVATPALYVGEIVGLPTSTTYRIRIDSAINAITTLGASPVFTQQ